MPRPDPIKSFNFWNRNRRELALWAYSVLRDVPHVYTPYLDHDLFDFLMGLSVANHSERPRWNPGDVFAPAPEGS